MNTIFKFLRFGLLMGISLVMLAGCAGSHYETMQDVQKAVVTGDFQHADDLISAKKNLQQDRNRVVFALEKGMIAHLEGQYQTSNQWFSEAVTQMEELDALSVTGTATEWILTEKIQPYRGEDFERVLVHYYMALNYLMLEQLQDALVECRQVNLLLQMLNDKYEQKNTYKTDAFLLYLSGIIYEALGETNDAFIDYRAAYETYTTDYRNYYGTAAPKQLIDNFLRTMSALGFQDILQSHQELQQHTWTSQQEYQQSARLVVIWDNGLAPYKVEQVYRDYFNLADHHDDDEPGCYVKFAFPELVARPVTYPQAAVSVNGVTSSLELGEDVASIATKNLEDRRVRTFAKAAARNLLKCAAEYGLEKKHKWLGILFGGLTELTEGADTRYWLLLPSSIHVTHMLVAPGVSDVELTFTNVAGQPANQKIFKNITFERGKTTFLIYRTF